METTTSTPHSITIEVRDYECDLAGGVNNAVFLNYFEHARHEFLKSHGLNFADFAKEKIGLIIARAEVDFKWSMYSGDVVVITSRAQRISRLRFEFLQEIRHRETNKLIAIAKFLGTVVDANNRPCMPQSIENVFGPVIAPIAQ